MRNYLTIPGTVRIESLFVFVIIGSLIFAIKGDLLIVLNTFASVTFLLYLSYKNQSKIFMPKWLIIVILIYLPFLIFGMIKNPDFHIDLKFHLFILASIIILGTIFKNCDIILILKIIILITTLIFFYYLSVFIGLLPSYLNFYQPEEGAAGYGYRINGPDVTAFFIIPFIYALSKRRVDKFIYFNLFIGLFCIILNGSFQHLAIFLIINSFVIIRRTYLLFLTPIILFILFNAVLQFARPLLHPKYVEKLRYVNQPWEYPTFQYRLQTLDIMLDKTTDNPVEIILGSGVGAKSAFFDKNDASPSLSRVRTFLEIDNGFFYVYHRAGIIGLLLFLLFHFYLIVLIKQPLTFRLVFLTIFLVVNILSIHYFTNSLYSIFIILALNRKVDLEDSF